MSAPHDFYQDALSTLLDEAEKAEEMYHANRHRYLSESDPRKKAENKEVAKICMRERYRNDPEYREHKKQQTRERYWADPEKARQQEREKYARRKAAKAQKEG